METLIFEVCPSLSSTVDFVLNDHKTISYIVAVPKCLKRTRDIEHGRIRWKERGKDHEEKTHSSRSDTCSRRRRLVGSGVHRAGAAGPRDGPRSGGPSFHSYRPGGSGRGSGPAPGPQSGSPQSLPSRLLLEIRALAMERPPVGLAARWLQALSETLAWLLLGQRPMGAHRQGLALVCRPLALQALTGFQALPSHARLLSIR